MIALVKTQSHEPLRETIHTTSLPAEQELNRIAPAADRNIVDSTREMIGKHPLPSLVIATAVGAVLAFVVKRRGK